jgi:hypothetical protein
VPTLLAAVFFVGDRLHHRRASRHQRPAEAPERANKPQRVDLVRQVGLPGRFNQHLGGVDWLRELELLGLRKFQLDSVAVADPRLLTEDHAVHDVGRDQQVVGVFDSDAHQGLAVRLATAPAAG